MEAIALEFKRGGLDRMNLSYRDDFGYHYDTWFIIYNFINSSLLFKNCSALVYMTIILIQLFIMLPSVTMGSFLFSSFFGSNQFLCVSLNHIF